MIVETTEEIDYYVLKHFDLERSKAFPPCAMSFINKGGKIQENVGNMGCHLRLSALGGSSRHAKGLYFSLWSGGHSIAKDWFDFILDKKISPWRPLLEHSRIIKDNKDHYQAIYITNIEDMPMQYLANLAVATRQPKEIASRMYTYEYLRDKKGLSPLNSLYILSHYNRIYANTWSVTPGGHFPFDSYGPISLHKLRDASPSLNKDLIFQRDKGYSPMNAIWFGAEGANIFKKVAKAIPYNGVFHNYFKYTNTVLGGLLIKQTLKTPTGDWLDKEIEKGEIFK